MTKIAVFILSLLLICFSVACAGKDSEPPRVASTYPQNMSQDVDPSIKEISVTFNEEMMDGSWSWAYEDKNKFPQIIGQAYYSDNYKKNTLPVKLESNREYVIWINTATLDNFRDKSGNPAFPFKFSFKTK